MYLKPILFLLELSIIITSINVIAVPIIYGKDGGIYGLFLFGVSAFLTYIAGLLSTRYPENNYLYLVHYDLHPTIIKYRLILQKRIKLELKNNNKQIKPDDLV